MLLLLLLLFLLHPSPLRERVALQGRVRVHLFLPNRSLLLLFLLLLTTNHYPLTTFRPFALEFFPSPPYHPAPNPHKEPLQWRKTTIPRPATP